MAQFLGLYQLENLHRAQTKFLMVAVVTGPVPLPDHPLLKPDLVLAPPGDAAKIQLHMAESNYPAWWPVVFISQSGNDEAEVVKTLEAAGLINLFSYRGGWRALVAGT